MTDILWFLVVFGISLATDWISKKVVLQKMTVGQRKKVYSVFYLRPVYNQGLAFGSFKGKTKGIKIGTTIAALLLTAIVFYHIYAYEAVLFSIAGGLLVGGAWGNLMERLSKGKVTDFLYVRFRSWPIFNLADVFLTIGMILFMVLLL
ncbi:MAG TPA: signal peptidase II [Eubacteriaceae bacterium]|nr:signal peptidase II [Eubacteriaceae bacterium]